MRFITDQEIDLRDGDQFDSKNYSQTLVQTILDAPKEPFTVGIFGEWGSGKSSIVKTAQGMLESEESKKHHFFTYDAWKYSNDSFRRTFLLKLADSLKLQGKDSFESFYKSKTEAFPVKREVNKGLLMFVVMLLTIAVSLSWVGQNLDYKITGQMVLMAIAIVISILTNISNEYVGTKQSSILFSPEQFEECFDDILSLVMQKEGLGEKVSNWFQGINHLRGIGRLVIVLDNIDRCERKVAYELLSDFKNFLGKENVVFIIPVDDEALRIHVSSISGSDTQEADEFLRKIFNVTLKIKPYKTNDLYDFTKNLSEKHSLALKPDTIDVIAKEYATNPRRIIQFLNSFVSERRYISLRKDDSFVSKNETLIALILLIREEWPELYKQLSDAPYKLKDLKQSILLSNNERAEIFLRKTHPHTENAADAVLKVIFTNQEQHPHIFDELINAISSRNEEVLTKYVKSTPDGLKYLAEYVIDELKAAIGRGVISSVASAFNDLVFLNHVSTFSEVLNKKILGELSRDENLMQCLENFENAEHLAKYLNELGKQKLAKPQNAVLSHLGELTGEDIGFEVNRLSDKWSALVKSMAAHCESKDVLKKLVRPLFQTYKNEEYEISSLNIPKENLKEVIGPLAVNKFIEKFDFDDEKSRTEIQYLLENQVVSSAEFEKWMNKYLTNSASFVNKTKEDFFGLIMLMIDALSKYDYAINESLLTKLVGQTFNPRNTSSVGRGAISISPMDEFATEMSDKKVIVDLLGWIYIASPIGSTKVAGSIDWLTIVANKGIEEESLVLKKLQWISNEAGLGLHQFETFLNSRKTISAELLDIYKRFLVEKDDDEYRLSDEGAHIAIEKFLHEIIKTDNPELEGLFSLWVKDGRVKEILTQEVSKLDSAVIADLPESVQETAYGNICEGDKIFEYEEVFQIIAAMNKQGNQLFNKQIEKVILHKLTKDESFLGGVEWIEQLDSFNGMKVSHIRSRLEEKLNDPELGERISACINKLSE